MRETFIRNVRSDWNAIRKYPDFPGFILGVFALTGALGLIGMVLAIIGNGSL